MAYKDPEKKRQYNREWYKRNPDYNREYNREWRKKNPERQREYSREWKKRNPDYHWEYYREYKREYEKDRKANDPQYRLNGNIATAIGFSLKGNKAGRRWQDLVGYTLEQLKQRLEVNFQKGMSFDNHGKWHVDHIRPQSLFHFTTAKDQAFKDCWALCNLQPLWAEDNLRKNNKF